MQLYIYSEDKKVFTCVRPAFLDPEETIKAGASVYAFPPNCTTIAPPAFKEGEVAIFDEAEECWSIIENHIGEIYYNRRTGEEVVIEDFGPVPSNCIKEKPVLLQELKIEKVEVIQEECTKELQKEIEIANIKAKVGDRHFILSSIDLFGDYKYIIYSNPDGESVKVTKEELQEAEKHLYLRKMLLEAKKIEIIKNISRCTSKKQLDKVDTSFDIKETLEELMKASTEEIDAFFSGD